MKPARRRRGAPPDPDRFAAAHRLPGRRHVTIDGLRCEVATNEAETPLGWLRRRKGPDGKPLIDQMQFEAGERLRRDFTIGQLMPRLTTDWSAVGGRQRKRRPPRDPAAITDQALAARHRVAAALAAAGPGLSDLLISVCCLLDGMEAAERRFGWPRRAGKVVLAIALDRLVAHSRLGSERRAPVSRRPA